MTGPAVAAVIVAAGIGFVSPRALARVPEPDDHPDKPAYIELASVRGLALMCAAVSGLVVFALTTQIRASGLIVWAFFVPYGVLLSYVDWQTRLLPKRLVIPGTLSVCVLVLVIAAVDRDPGLVVSAALSAGAVFAVFFVLWLIYPRGLGYGDVRFSASLALALSVLGLTQLLVGLYAAFVIGAVGAIVLSVLRLVNARQFAFGPYLVIGAIVGAGWGPQLAALM